MMDLQTARFDDLPGIFTVSHSYDAKTGYSQVIVNLRDDPDHVFVIVHGVQPANDASLNADIFDHAEQPCIRIARNGQECAPCGEKRKPLRLDGEPSQ